MKKPEPKYIGMKMVVRRLGNEPAFRNMYVTDYYCDASGEWKLVETR